MVTMRGVTTIFSVLIFLESVCADSATFSINGHEEKEKIQMTLPALNDTNIPAWVDEWKAPEILRKLFPFFISGYDFDGSPVYVIELGRWKVAETIRSYEDGSERAFDLITKYLDKCGYHIYRDGKANIDQGDVAIVDFDEFSISNIANPLALKVVLRLFQWLNRLYPVFNYAFFINTNFAAESVINLGRPLMGKILEKCEIFGSQKSKWLPHLLRKIPTHQLPPWYGGPNDWQPVTVGLEPFNSSTVRMK